MNKKIAFFALLACMVGMQISTPLFAMNRSSKSVNFSGFINQSNLQNDMDSDVGLDYEADDELSKLGNSLSSSCSVTPHDSRSGSVRALTPRPASLYIRPISAMSFRSNSTATTHADDVSPMPVEDDLLRSDSVMTNDGSFSVIGKSLENKNNKKKSPSFNLLAMQGGNDLGGFVGKKRKRSTM